MNTKTGVLMGVACIAGMTVIGSSFAYMGNTVANEEVKNAIQSNDYNAFIDSAPSKLIQRIDSQEAFTQFAQQHQEQQALHDAMQSQVLEAVQNNDFTAFQKVHTNMKAKMKELHDAVERAEGDEDHQQRVRPKPTPEHTAAMEAKQLEHFNEMVTYYTENGELPEHSFNKGFRKHGFKKGHGKRGERNRNCEGREKGQQKTSNDVDTSIE